MAYMKVPTAPIKKGEHPELFDKQGFAAETTEDCIVCNIWSISEWFSYMSEQNFVKRFVASQMFAVFLQNCITGQRKENDPFDVLVQIKNERRKTKMGKLTSDKRVSYCRFRLSFCIAKEGYFVEDAEHFHQVVQTEGASCWPCRDAL